MCANYNLTTSRRDQRPIYYRTKAILCTCGSVYTQNKTGPDNARVQAAESLVSGVQPPFGQDQWRDANRVANLWKTTASMAGNGMAYVRAICPTVKTT
jgi:hypothetical protein